MDNVNKATWREQATIWRKKYNNSQYKLVIATAAIEKALDDIPAFSPIYDILQEVLGEIEK